MKQQKTRKKSLKSTLLLLLLTAALLISSSYAWFTSNQTVKVDSLNVYVEAKNGLQISTDGTTWKSTIQTADLTSELTNTNYPAVVNQVPATLEPVSTAGNLTSGKLDMYYATINPNDKGTYLISAEKSNEANKDANGKFIAFDLFFKVEKDTDIVIEAGSGAKYADANSKGLENAARMAFLVEGNASSDSTTKTFQDLNGAQTATTYIWEPNYNTHTGTGVTNAKDTYNLTTTTTDTNALAYSGIKAAITADDNVTLASTTKTHSVAYPDFFGDVTPTYKTVNGDTNDLDIFDLTAGVTKVRVYMWVEGQDVDCENNASGANITYDLVISIKK